MILNPIITETIQSHRDHYGRFDLIVKSPGRVNIIGEHTDYNNGLVLPFAIDQSIYIILGRNTEKKLRIFAKDFNEEIQIDLADLKQATTGWYRYFVNSLLVLEMPLDIGIDVTFGGEIPIGAGVSSSSAITCGFLYGLNDLFQLELSNSILKSLASQAENGIGLMGGMMDQTVILNGKSDHAILIDFLSNEETYIPLELNGYSFYLFESGQKHNLVETKYNERRRTCEEALHLVMKEKHFTNTLRDVSLMDVDLYLHDHTMKKRITHVIQENERVEKAVKSISNSDFEHLGELLTQTHKSLSELYEVSTPEIDFLVEQSLQCPTILGSRIMGGGFGGCTLNLVKGKLTNDEESNLIQSYFHKTGLKLKIHEVNACRGVHLIH